jgi:hypothetical protein
MMMMMTSNLTGYTVESHVEAQGGQAADQGKRVEKPAEKGSNACELKCEGCGVVMSVKGDVEGELFVLLVAVNAEAQAQPLRGVTPPREWSKGSRSGDGQFHAP